MDDDRPKRIIIAGAGISGLAAAYQLGRLGHEIIILEGRDRIGGRIETLRKPFSDGLFAEAGAYFICDQHRLATKYITDVCGLQLAPILPMEAPTLYFLREHGLLTISSTQGLGDLARQLGLSQDDPLEAWPGFDLTTEEKQLGLFRFRNKYCGLSEASLLGNPAEPDWPPAHLAEHDKMDMQQWLNRQGASSLTVTLMRPWLVPFLDEFDRVSALNIYREAALARVFGNKEAKWFTLERGTASLPEVLATKLRGTFRMQSRVVAIEQHAKGVTARYVDLRTGAPVNETGDHLICTIPFSVLRDVNVTPAFSASKRRAIEELPYTSIARVYVQCKERVWAPEPERWKGVLFTDLPVGAVIDSTAHQQSSRAGILHSYVAGDYARAITAMKESDRIDFLLEALKRIFPGIKESFEKEGRRGTSKCWNEDEWAKGGYAYFKPGQMFDLIPHIAEAEDKVHFAGDHTSPMPGWIEGALQSAHRVAREIDTRASVSM